MFKLKRTMTIAASHSLKDHPKCGKMHGHNYQITITVTGSDNAFKGMLIDFGDLKSIMNSVLERYDHMHIGRLPDGWTGNPEHIIEVPFEYVSSENLAKHWGQEISAKLPEKLRLLSVEVRETEKNVAIWENN